MIVCVCSSSTQPAMNMNEAVVSETSDTSVDIVGSCGPPAEPKNPKADTVSSVKQIVEPREHRRPNRPGIVWAAGSRLEARDFVNKWYTLLKCFYSFIVGRAICCLVSNVEF